MKTHEKLLIIFTSLISISAANPIELHPKNPHYLMWRDKPVVLVTSAEHYGAVLNTDFDYNRYLETLRADGMNLTRTFSGAYCEPVGAFNIKFNTLGPARNKLICPWARSGRDGYANGGNRFDLTKWDDKYFKRLKAFVSKADKCGVVVEFVMFCPFYKDAMWELSPMNIKNNVNGIGSMKREDVYTLKDKELQAVQDKMVCKIVTELKDFDNLYYEICNEPYFGGVTLGWQKHIAQVITDTEKKLGVKHLIAQNIANKTKKIKNPDPNVSIFNFHYAKPPTAVTENYHLNKPIGDDETGFAGSDDKVYRIEAWNFIMAGGGIYNNLDYSFFPGKEDGTGKNKAPGGGGVSFRKQMKILSDTVNSFDFINAVPDRSVISSIPGKISAYCLAKKGLDYIIYFSGRNGKIDVVLDIPKGTYRLYWIDTKNAQKPGNKNVTVKSNKLKLKSPDFTDDIALRISRK